MCWVASWPHLYKFSIKIHACVFRRLSLHNSVSFPWWNGEYSWIQRGRDITLSTHTRFFFFFFNVIWIKNAGIWKRRNCWTNQTSSYSLPPNHKKKNVRWRRYWFKYSRNLLCNLQDREAGVRVNNDLIDSYVNICLNQTKIYSLTKTNKKKRFGLFNEVNLITSNW